ncbi:MAG: vitamin K epoxide reductase family protein [Parcubacteria group bacterium]|nr:vitamin K epoxide reductase family protein [Parcubacteria group bacterium]
MYLVYLFIVLSVGGIIDASYLLYKKVKKIPLSCPINDDCSVVTQSKWSKVFGIHNETLGVINYIFLVLVVIVSLFLSQWAQTIFLFLLFITGAGFLYSLYLTYIQAFRIKSFCFYCLISAILSLLIFINNLLIIYYYA